MPKGTDSAYNVTLCYSSDNIEINMENKKKSVLYAGGDIVTKILNHFSIRYTIRLASDFHNSEPFLEEISKYDKYGELYFVYSRWNSHLYDIDGKYNVLAALESMRVIPCSYEEAVCILRGKNE